MIQSGISIYDAFRRERLLPLISLGSNEIKLKLCVRKNAFCSPRISGDDISNHFIAFTCKKFPKRFSTGFEFKIVHLRDYLASSLSC